MSISLFLGLFGFFGLLGFLLVCRILCMSPNLSSPQRRIEIDLLRSVAIMLMVLYHLFYNLRMFFGWPIDLFALRWTLFARTTATLFLLLVGVSFALSWQRSSDMTLSARYRKYLRRGIGLLACGTAVSLVTVLFDPGTYVRFGILHLVGTSILVLPLLTGLGMWNAVLGVAIIAAGQLTQDITTTAPLLLPLGIRTPFFVSVDYFPLLPWFGVILIGYVVGDWVYLRHHPTPLLSFERSSILHTLAWPGRYSLLIYLVHQPLLLIILTLVLR